MTAAGTPSNGELLQTLRGRGMRLSEVYPYSAWVGDALARLAPEIWRDFQASSPREAALPLHQARNYALLSWAEEQRAGQALDKLLTRALDSLTGAQQLELRNTVEWY